MPAPPLQGGGQGHWKPAGEILCCSALAFIHVESNCYEVLMGPSHSFPWKSWCSIWNFFALIFVGVELIYNVVLVSAVQQSESVIHIYISALFFRFFCHIDHYRPLNRVSLCCVVGPYQLSILCIACCLVARSCPILLRSHGLSMGLSREECWSVLPFPSPGDLPDPGITLTAPATSPALSVGSLPLSHQGNPFYT